jgi:hypothetical protein
VRPHRQLFPEFVFHLTVSRVIAGGACASESQGFIRTEGLELQYVQSDKQVHSYRTSEGKPVTVACGEEITGKSRWNNDCCLKGIEVDYQH